MDCSRKNITVKSAFLTNIGKVRTNNEDSLLLPDRLLTEISMIVPESHTYEGERLLFVVADGMGGHEKGEAASREVLQAFQENAARIEKTEDILNTVGIAYARLNTLARHDSRSHGLGATVAGVIFLGERALVFNCGDSRVYRQNGPYLEKLSRDHSIVQNLADNGQITEDEMRTHPRKSILTSVIMGDLKNEPPEVWCREIRVNAGQRFFLCTDGVWECMGIEELEACFGGENPQAIAGSLYARINAGEARDNFTLIVLEMEKS